VCKIAAEQGNIFLIYLPIKIIITVCANLISILIAVFETYCINCNCV